MSWKLGTSLCVVALLSLTACKGCKDKKADSASGPTTEKPNIPPPPTTGTLEGDVAWSGTAPARQPLKRDSDPFCAKTQALDEEILTVNGKLGDVFVRLTKDAPQGPLPTDTLVIDAKDCVLRPRLMGAAAGQTLSIRNSDATLHTIHGFRESNSLFSQGIPAGASPIERKLEAGTDNMQIKCDAHPWEIAHVVEVTNPFFATTADTGHFVIKNVPPGTFVLEAWHATLGKRTSQVKVTAGQTTKVLFTYSMPTPPAPPQPKAPPPPAPPPPKRR